MRRWRSSSGSKIFQRWRLRARVAVPAARRDLGVQVSGPWGRSTGRLGPFGGWSCPGDCLGASSTVSVPGLLCGHSRGPSRLVCASSIQRRGHRTGPGPLGGIQSKDPQSAHGRQSLKGSRGRNEVSLAIPHPLGTGCHSGTFLAPLTTGI